MYYNTLDHTCNKYCNLIGQEEVTICDSHLHDSDSHLQLHSLEHEAKLGCIHGHKKREPIEAAVLVQQPIAKCLWLSTQPQATAQSHCRVEYAEYAEHAHSMPYVHVCPIGFLS